MLFSLVVPTYNNLSELKACLGGLGGLKTQDFEVLICVDGSTDGTVEFLEKEKYAFKLKVLQHSDGENHGRSAARNLALTHLKGDYTLFLDSDMEANPDLLQQHLKVLKFGKRVSLGPVVYRNEKENLWARYISERGICKFSHLDEVPHHYFITPNTAVPTFWIKEMGGFDEEINRYGGEDMELGYRIFKKYSPGFIFNKFAMVSTVQEKSLDHALKELQEYGGTNLRYIVKKWPALGEVYWVNKVYSIKLKDRVFGFLTRDFFQGIAKLLVKIPIYSLQKNMINYLVVSSVHRGYRQK